MTDVSTLYDEDFVAWSKQQAKALRAAGRTGSNQLLDWENLAEEIESLGKSDRRELASRLSVIIEHLVKLEHSSARNPRRKWRQTILRERREIVRILSDSPSLRNDVAALIEDETARTVEIAIGDLDLRREINRDLRQKLASKAYLELLHYSADQVLGDWFPPDPKA
jgi:hypothetical protein